MTTPGWRHSLVLVCACVVALAAGCRRGAPGEGGAPGTSPGGELVASLRSEPGNYNRYFELSAPAELVSLLTQARLVRINRATDEAEAGLAESWTQGADGSYTLRLREGVTFSDGAPLTAADVLFSFQVAYDGEQPSAVADAVSVAGRRLTVSSPDPRTVVVGFPAPFAPGVRVLDNLPILPRHKLEPAFREKRVRNAWTPGMALSGMVGAGPFVLSEHVPGQRMVFTRNPRYWRRGEGGAPLPNLDRLTVEIIPDQNAEALRLEAGAIDLMANADIRTDDYMRFKRLADQGRLRLIDVGVGLDANLLWFNLAPARQDARPWLRHKAFRQALSYGVDRQAFINTVYLGAAVPVSGPLTPGNATWYPAAPPVHAYDPARARRLLAEAGLTDRNGDGVLEDARGTPVRFSVLLQAGHTVRQRSVSVLQEQFRRLGVGLDLVETDPPTMIKRWQAGEYDGVFHGFQLSATDPAMTLDFWLSSGGSHFWNPGQAKPATDWEARIDALMQQQVRASGLEERRQVLGEVLRLFDEHLPAIYYAAPRVTAALSPRVRNVAPAPMVPQLLWAADTLAVSGPRPGR